LTSLSPLGFSKVWVLSKLLFPPTSFSLRPPSQPSLFGLNRALNTGRVSFSLGYSFVVSPTTSLLFGGFSFCPLKTNPVPPCTVFRFLLTRCNPSPPWQPAFFGFSGDDVPRPVKRPEFFHLPWRRGFVWLCSLTQVLLVPFLSSLCVSCLFLCFQPPFGRLSPTLAELSIFSPLMRASLPFLVSSKPPIDEGTPQGHSWPAFHPFSPHTPPFFFLRRRLASSHPLFPPFERRVFASLRFKVALPLLFPTIFPNQFQ